MGWIIFGALLGAVVAAAIAIITNVSVSSYNDKYDVRRGDLPKKSYKIPLAAMLIAFFAPVLLFTFVASTIQLDTGQIGVVTRFGKVTGKELGEGFHFKSPFEDVTKYDIKVQKDDSEASAASKDLQDVKVKLVVNYTLEAGKVSEIHKTVGELYREKLIYQGIQEVVKASTAKFDATQLITDRPSVKAVAVEELKERLEKYGIQIQDISIVDMQFSPEFTQAIEAKQVAQQEAQKAVFLAEKATQEANAEIERAKGSAEAQRLQQQTLTAEILQKQAIEKWDGKLPVYSTNGNAFFNIPTGGR